MSGNTMFTEQYRPYRIDDLIGQPQVKRVVGAWLRTKRVPRSILITGDMSAGKTTTARIIARSLLCLDLTDGGACGKCTSCQAFDAERHQDYAEMNSASDRGIDAMRALASKVKMLPTMSRHRVIVMDECHAVTPQGWGALLKPLEEPPEHVVFILVTTNPEKVLDTIVSRCSRVRLSSITVEDCTELLTSVAERAGLGKAGITTDHLTRIAAVTKAHPRNALHALDQVYTMVLDAEDTGQTVDTALVNSFIRDVAVSDIDNTAAAVVTSILAGQAGSALKRAEDTWSQADLLLVKITEIMRQAMLMSTNPKLSDPAYGDLFKTTKIFSYTGQKCPEHMAARHAVLDAYACFTRLRVETSGHGVPVHEVIGEPIARSSLICRAFLRDVGAGKVTAPQAQDDGRVSH